MAARGQDLRDTVSRLMKTWLAFLQRPESDGHLGHLQDLRGGGGDHGGSILLGLGGHAISGWC